MKQWTRRLWLSKLEWKLFALNLTPGLTWGLVGLAIAHRVFGMNDPWRFHEWEMARPSILFGMTLGVPSYAIYWLRSGCPKIRQFQEHLVEVVLTVTFGIAWGCIGWVCLGVIGVFFGQPAGIVFAMFAPFYGGVFALVTVLPASILMRPLHSMFLERWHFEENQKNIVIAKA